MNILSIDTVLDKSYIALSLNDKDIYRQINSDEKNYHSAYLIKVLKEILNENNVSLKDVDYIGVNTGVGSFTGIRVGLTIAKVISNRLNIKTVPYNTAEVLSNAFDNKNIMLDARRNSVFRSKNGADIELISYEEALQTSENSNERYISDLSLYENAYFEKIKSKLIPYEKENKNLAIAELAVVKNKIKENKITDTYSLKPTYIQTPPIFMK
ncbi:TPA: tRNA (adenosine(37)-N6)-threonylcarbamoyltransferase complex dimerization subunit type 1 TsaB [Candidatus Galligastranaerophilus gallistercoris]|nr:tRNA (adenosine(37)-N6)-threonylcarbamoyltransferase complex dimerization subunit type 1 TsaB [Candidatus Galligastranaerophilus gallistercoris]